MGSGFDSASSRWDQPAVGRWLSLLCAPLSSRGRGMTPPPPGCAALGAWRARVPGPLARSAPLLLLLLWTAAASQGHPRNGPRISAVWKGGWSGGQRGPAGDAARGGGGGVRYPRGCVRAALGPGLPPQGACGSG